MTTADAKRLASAIEGLRSYQRVGVNFLLHRDAALLADEMGLGKTVQAAVALEASKGMFRRALLVAPASLCLNWVRELEAWAPSVVVRRVVGDALDRQMAYRLPIELLITSYEQLRSDIDFVANSIDFDLVILDEIQRIKNASSTTSLACRRLRRSRAWGLSGTPIENSVDDLLAIFRFVSPQLLLAGMSRSEVHLAMKDYFLRRTKAEVLSELPPIMIRDIRVELGIEQRQAYQAVWSERLGRIRKYGAPVRVASMLALLTHLKRICNFETTTGASAKADILDGLIGSIAADRGKVLIFSQFVETLKWLSNRVTIAHEIFHGGLTPFDREQMISRFRERPGPRALLVSLKAGGVGLNLQEASTVILFDRWWNPAVENQAIQRAHRFGKDMPLAVVRFIVEDTVEERIAEILQDKAALFETYIEGAPSSTPEELSDQELHQILKL